MNKFRKLISSALIAGVSCSPLHQASAQSAISNAACITYVDLPAGVGIATKVAGDTHWEGSAYPGRVTLLTHPSQRKASVRIWKQVPQGSSDRSESNLRTYSIDLAPTSKRGSCDGLSTIYRVVQGTAGWQLVHDYSPPQQESSAPAKADNNGPTAGQVIGGLILLGVLAAIVNSASSGSSSSSSSSSSNNENDGYAQRRIDRDNAARQAAEQAERSRRAAEAYERLRHPNSLGW